MQQYDINRWIDRIQNLKDTQKVLCWETIAARYNERDLFELLTMLKDLKCAKDMLEGGDEK